MLTRSNTTTAPGGIGAHSFRADIEGLRAVAILLVVAFHAGVPGFSGGFVGVDVFFVLSGYLITALLVQEREAKGRIDLVRFYARRARRLLPGAALMLIATMVAGGIILAPVEQATVARTALATAMYASNLWFARNGTDYLGDNADANPLLHTWSLAVEEQFYFVWPTVIILAMRGSARRARLIGVLLTITVAALIGSVLLTRYAQPWAFFGSPARAWEFGVGGLAALLPASALRRWPRQTVALTLAGAIAVVSAGVFFTRSLPFPGLAALLPALGTVAVLIGGAGLPGQVILRPLQAKPFQWLGRLSYSWYLWHWPALVLVSTSTHSLSLAARVATVLASLVVAWAAHHLVENRVRYSAYLGPRPLRSLGLAGAMTALCMLAALHWRGIARDAEAAPTQQRYAAAHDDLPAVYADRCHLTFLEVEEPSCVFGDTTSQTTVVLFGDSHAAQWFPAVDEIARARHWRLVSYTKSGCPPASVEIYALGRLYVECDQWREAMLTQIVAMRPVLIIIAGAAEYVDDTTAQAHGGVTPDEWRVGLTRTLARLSLAGVPIDVIADSPRPGFDVPICLSRAAWQGLVPEEVCSTARSGTLDAAVKRAEREAVATSALAREIDLSDEICGVETCQPERDGEVIYRDSHHLTAVFSARLASALGGQL